MMRLCRFIAFTSLIAVASACTTDDRGDEEIWEDPVLDAAIDEPVTKPESAPSEKNTEVDDGEAAPRPWEPDTSMGTEVRDEELTFEGESIKKAPQGGEDQIADAFNPNAGYVGDDSIAGDAVPESAAEDRNQKVLWVAANSLHVRSSPSATAQIVGTLKLGSKVFVSQKSNGWSKIGAKRYVRSKHLTGKRP